MKVQRPATVLQIHIQCVSLIITYFSVVPCVERPLSKILPLSLRLPTKTVEIIGENVYKVLPQRRRRLYGVI